MIGREAGTCTMQRRHTCARVERGGAAQRPETLERTQRSRPARPAAKIQPPSDYIAGRHRTRQGSYQPRHHDEILSGLALHGGWVEHRFVPIL